MRAIEARHGIVEALAPCLPDGRALRMAAAFSFIRWDAISVSKAWRLACSKDNQTATEVIQDGLEIEPSLALHHMRNSPRYKRLAVNARILSSTN